MSDDTTFGDSEPEDAWHPDDPLPLLIENLLRRLDLLEGRDWRDRRMLLLDEIATRLAPWLRQRNELSVRDRLRVDQIREDLEHVTVRSG